MEYEQKIVEAIEEGKIVRVTEHYARREGLPILRRSPSMDALSQHSLPEEKMRKLKSEYKLDIHETLKKKPSWKEKQVMSELLENFNWIIRTERRKKNISRSQLAKMVGESEDDIKMLEYGVLPKDDFILINKVQQALNVNLRKDGKDFSKSLPDLMRNAQPGQRTSVLDRLKKLKEAEKQKAQSGSLSGSEIEILDEEI